MTDEDHADEPVPTGSAVVPVVARRRARVRTPLLLTFAVMVVSVLFGVTTAEASGSFGPHTARYRMTVDHEVTVDLGPLGTVVIDSPLPLVLGVRVVVEEIPADFSAVDQAGTIEALSQDLQRYVQLFTAPQVAVEAAVRALVRDAAWRALLAAGVLVGVGWGVRSLLGPTRRRELVAAVGPHRGGVAAGTVLGLVVVGGLTSSVVLPAPVGVDRQASAVFDGTPLEGARITGRLARLVDTYGGYALDAYRENEQWYASATDAVTQAWQARHGRELAAAALIEGYRTPEVATIDALVVTDLHCNVGMVPVIRDVAELADVDLVLNAGDTTIDGTAVESYCVQAFADAVPDGVPYVVADGNHDSSLTSAQARAVGAEVLDGRVVEVAGLRVLGDSDPNATRIGQGTSQVGGESEAEVGHRLADVACEDGAVDLLLIHTPVVGTEALERGCVPAQVSGHLHTRIGPTRFGEGVRYVSSATSGATLNEPTVGPLRGTAELTVLRFDAETHELLDFRLIRVQPDGTAQVDPALRWPSSPIQVPRPGDPV